MGASTILWVGAGGFLGAISRFVISSFVTKLAGASFPYGTLIVNIIGATAIGFLFLYFQNHASAPMKAFLITGLLGALTTFSTFSLETILLMQDQLYTKALISIVLNVTLSLVATLLGMMIYKKIYGL